MGLRYTTQLKDRENFDLPNLPRFQDTRLCFFMLRTLVLRFDIFVCHCCFAATIELMNGTFIGVKDCFRGDYCNSSSVCTNVTGGLPGISFKRCEASCCSQSSCNKYLPASWPPSPRVSAMSSVSVNATQTPATKAKDTDPTAAGINVKAVYYLPICLLAVIQIMS